MQKFNKPSLGEDWYIRTDPRVTKALEAIEQSDWPYPFRFGRSFNEPNLWDEMPAVSVLEIRISFLSEGSWNEPEMADEWAAWDAIAPIEMANLTTILNNRCKEVLSWKNDIRNAPRAYQINQCRPIQSIVPNLSINDPSYKGPTWDEITAHLIDSYGIRTSSEVLRKEAKFLRDRIKNWIADRLKLKSTPEFERWRKDVLRFEKLR